MQQRLNSETGICPKITRLVQVACGEREDDGDTGRIILPSGRGTKGLYAAAQLKDRIEQREGSWKA